MIARHFQVRLHFTVALEDDLERAFPLPECGAAGALGRERMALLARTVMGALLSDPAAVDLLVRNYVVSELCSLESADLAALVGVPLRDEAEIVGPLLERLSPEAKDFLTLGGEELDAPEHMDLVSENVDVQLVAATLVEV
ncbi:MAG TPA: hypothetical protein VHG91_04390 [Longimicrobium sp.]|nr:hypothetical protein [Longimicrobium sp.]